MPGLASPSCTPLAYIALCSSVVLSHFPCQSYANLASTDPICRYMMKGHVCQRPGGACLQERDALSDVFCNFPERFAKQFRGKGHEV